MTFIISTVLVYLTRSDVQLAENEVAGTIGYVAKHIGYAIEAK